MRQILLGFDASLHSVKPPSSIKSSNRGVLNRSDLPRLQMLSAPCAETPNSPRPANQSAAYASQRRKAGIVAGAGLVAVEPGNQLPAWRSCLVAADTGRVSVTGRHHRQRLPVASRRVTRSRSVGLSGNKESFFAAGLPVSDGVPGGGGICASHSRMESRF
jgi:hypothetical protein